MISDTGYVPQVGDIGLTQISGETGQLIRFGQWLDGTGYSDFEHAFVLADPDLAPRGMIIEAEPGGARYVQLHYDNVHWCRGLAYGLTNAQRELIAEAAIDYIGTPYSALDYFSLVAKRLHLPDAALHRYVESTKHMICSQLAARAYYDAGSPLFGAWTGDDTPGDLYRQDLLLRGKYSIGV
jgi:hypothetical protein